MKTAAARVILGLLVVTLIFAAVVTGGYIELREQNKELRLGQERVERNQIARESVPQQEVLSNADKLELMRLRNEVTQLRASAAAAREAVKDALENRAREEQDGLVGQDGSAKGKFEFRLEDLIYRGYATPEDAFVSALAAMKDGDVQTMLNSMTAEERARWEQLNAGKTVEEIQARFQKEFGNIQTMRITGEEQLSPTELVLDVEMERPFTKRVRMNLERNEWKAGAPINQNKQTVAMANAPQQAVQNVNPANGEPGTYDPLAFYRKNPELMKRYFPHLYQGDLEQQQGVANVQQPQQPAMNPELMRRYFPHLQQQAEQVQQSGTLPPEPSPNE